jgi:hypothetical protein
MNDDEETKSEETKSEETKSEETKNETVAAMGAELRPDVPVGLARIPDGANAHALARRTAGEIVQNEMEFHCMSCGWNKSLQLDKDEMEALDNDIRGYTGPCPKCGSQMLVPKDAYWGKDFPTMTELSDKAKRHEARVHAEELVSVVQEKVTDLMGAGMVPQPSAPATGGEPGDRDDLPDEPDLSNLKPR